MTVDDSAIIGIIRFYTREAGVRSLEREISKLCRKAVKTLLMDKKRKHIEINGDNLKDYLGVQRVDYGRADTENRVGEVTGLAWTEVGGDLLTIETACVPGKGKLTYTGSLGEVMQESIQAALTVARARGEIGHQRRFLRETRHPRARAGRATPKDGPSAGIAMCTALVSCLTGNPVRADVAMTGEISCAAGIADRRPEREAVGGASRRHQNRADPLREQARSGRDSGQCYRRSGDSSGAANR